MSTAQNTDIHCYRTPVWFRNPDDEDSEDLSDDLISLRRQSTWHTYRSTMPIAFTPSAIAEIAAEELAERDAADWMDFDGVVIVTVGPTEKDGKYRSLPDHPPTDGSFGELLEFVVEVEVEISATVKPYKRPGKPVEPEPHDPLLPEVIPHDPRQGQLAFDEPAP